VIDLTGGHSALKLTVATYWRPNGHNIHRSPDATEDDEWGVVPNEGFTVELTEDEFREVVVDRRLRDIVGSASPTIDEATEGSSDEAETAGSVVDPQLEKALEYLREKLNSTDEAQAA